MKTFFRRLTILLFIVTSCTLAQAQKEASARHPAHTNTEKMSSSVADSAASDDEELDSAAARQMASSPSLAADSSQVEQGDAPSIHKELKTKFIEGNAGFMSFVALALVLGLAFCIERIIYLSLSEINAKKQCRDTRGPVASICYQGLERIDEAIDNIERSIVSYGSVQSANLEKGCSWITLFIAMAPSLGFLGTVVGMVMAFDQIQTAGDISPTIVAAGMKVALITTIFGIIVALILQLFYNYILSKIDHLTSQMEESSITLLDSIMKYKLKK